ncbi:MAG: efflux RND transporter periplasmic adaptor subunit [Rhodocyclales bacterium]|nr:efflux RND transporter periplasmic adaptor subunit [Rhodocyclales bacterium]
MNSRLVIFAAALALAACQKAEEKKPSGPPPTLITVTQAKAGAMEIAEETLGTLEALIDPKIGAEVAGKVVQVLAGAGKAVRKGDLLAVIDDADIALQHRADEAERKRAEALLAQQERVVERQLQLVQKGFISQNAADDARAQRDALRQQLAAAGARGDLSRRSQGKARVLAPIDGVVEIQIASAGDYVKVGDPLFQLVSGRKLRAHLPFPESAAPRLRKGQTVVLTSPQRPGSAFRGVVSEIKPSVSESGRALDVLVDIDNTEGFRPGGTVNAAVVVAVREDAVLVPEQSVVLRPAGKVVYAIADGKAVQHVVEVGAKRAGMVEIVKGLPAGATVALDGAGFLTNNAGVSVQERGKPAAGKPAESQSPQHGAAEAQAPAEAKK